MQSYRYSEPGTVHNSDFTMDEFEGSREFRDIVNAHGRLGNPVYDSEAKTCNPQMGCVVTGYQTMARPGIAAPACPASKTVLKCAG